MCQGLCVDKGIYPLTGGAPVAPHRPLSICHSSQITEAHNKRVYQPHAYCCDVAMWSLTRARTDLIGAVSSHAERRFQTFTDETSNGT